LAELLDPDVALIVKSWQKLSPDGKLAAVWAMVRALAGATTQASAAKIDTPAPPHGIRQVTQHHGKNFA
jgi:hypothetical protein